MTKLDKTILFENEQVVAVNKPAGVLSIPDRFDQHLPSMSKMLQQKYGQVFVVHRIDRDTSGVLLFAKDRQAHEILSKQFESREIEKYYYALVNGRLSATAGRIESAIAPHPGKPGKMTVSKKGKPAISEYEVMETFALFSWLKIQIQTGRTHQIRVHMQSIGHPVVMDELYGVDNPIFLSSLKRRYHLGKHDKEERPLLKRLALHAAIIRFRMPGSDVLCTIEAPLPKDLHATLQQLRKLRPD